MFERFYNLEERDRLVTDMMTALNDFESGFAEPIETARRFGQFQGRDKELDLLLRPFSHVDSETDALPIGKVRELWKPDALDKEDIKIVEAQAWAKPIIASACEALKKRLQAVPFW